MERRLAEARAGLPRIAVDEAALAAHVARVDPEGTCERLPDLVVAFAAARGDATAIGLVEHILVDIRPSLLVLRLSPEALDEVLQQVRARLLMTASDGTPPRLEAYGGKGPLGAFVRVVATRLALSARRAHDPLAGTDDGLATLAADQDSAELATLRATHAETFRAALHAALAELEPEQRSVLRLQLLDGLGVDEIGLVHRVHRATAARWIVRAKEDLRKRTRRQLEARLALRGPELESLVAALQSRLDLSLERVLRDLA